MTEKWQVGFDDGSGCGEDGDGIWILVADSEQGPADVIVMGGKSDGIPLGVIGRTNATLIAQSPALYEALEEMLDEILADTIVAPDPFREAYNKGRAALAAARGTE